jgi:CubicO group peptidase (beta-lactamase class C family)
MRNRILLAGVFSLLTIGVHEYAWCICPSANPGQPRVRGVEKASRQTDLETRIARIENGLLPAVTIKGQPLKMMTISDRMKHYKVPGVSLAFFDHEQILWTRTYGFADVATKRPVKTETLFQAASISKPVSALAALRLF